MDEIRLKRGTEEVTFKKLPEHFAVRMKEGRADSERALEASVGSQAAETRYVDSVPESRMDVFAVRDQSTLESTMDGLRESSESEVVTHMYSTGDSEENGVVPTGTMTIQFESDVDLTEREEVLGEFGLEVVEDLDFLDDGYTVALTEQSTENPLKIAQKLQSRDGILTAEPDLSFRISLKYTPSDTEYASQWHLTNHGDAVGLTAGADVKAESAWDYTRGDRDVVVCVMDDGFDLEHPDFSSPAKIVAPRDFEDDDVAPEPQLESDNHGTACAGVAVAEENGSGVVGLAPDCSLMPVRTSRWLSDESIVALFQHAMDEGADIISCSWSAVAWNFPLSTKMNAIIHKAATQGRDNGKGCVILFAAGNENRPLDGEKDGQRSHQGFALHPDVVAVGASNSLDKRSPYSNYGPELTLCAPSSGAPGRRITTTDRRGPSGYESGDYTYQFGGTSSSTPLAAGLAALILSVKPDLTSVEVRETMMNTAEKIDEAGGEYDNGHSPWYGHGRIDATKALAYVSGDGEGQLPQVLSVKHSVDRPIPDQGEIDDVIPFPLDLEPRRFEVSVDIKHTWRGDLRVSLRSPSGTEAVLSDRSGGQEDDLVRTYRSNENPELFEGLLSGSPKGDWRLTVADTASDDVGRLVEWSVSVAYDSA